MCRRPNGRCFRSSHRRRSAPGRHRRAARRSPDAQVPSSIASQCWPAREYSRPAEPRATARRPLLQSQQPTTSTSAASTPLFARLYRTGDATQREFRGRARSPGIARLRPPQRRPLPFTVGDRRSFQAVHHLDVRHTARTVADGARLDVLPRARDRHVGIEVRRR